jgi:hypothetical protein
MKPYAELECDDLGIIQRDIYNFLLDQTELGSSDYKNWQFLETKKLISATPRLAKFFLKYKLYIRNAAVTVLYEDLPLHLDEPPMVAKINIPIKNTQGWVNRWYDVSKEVIEQLPKIHNQFGNEQDRERVNRDNWPWIHNRGQDTYMHAEDQEWILQLESSYPEIVYPPGLEHVDLTVTCGELLQAHAHEWELARHDGSNSNN